MSKIVYVKTRYNYDSYTDLHRLFELAGFPSIYVDELDVSEPGVYIVSPHNGEWDPHIKNQEGKQRNAHLIHWNLERPSGSSGSVGQYGQRQRDLLYQRMFDEVWVSDKKLAEETSLRYVTLGSHPKFGTPGEEKDKHWTFCHLSYMNPRRQTVLKYFSPSEIGPNSWAEERDDVLKRSRFGLATHQDDHPFMEPLRLAIFAAYGLPTLTETLVDSFPYGDTLFYAGYDFLVATMQKLKAQDYSRMRVQGQRMRELMTVQYEFGKMVREAVEQRVGDWR